MKCRTCSSEAEVSKTCCRTCLDKNAAYMRRYNSIPVNQAMNKERCSSYYMENREVEMPKHRRWYDRNREMAKAQKRAYHHANREVLLPKHREYWEVNRERLIAQKRQQYASNAAAILLKQKQVYEANPERFRAQKRDDYLKHREKRIAAIKAYQLAHPEWHAANRYERSARRRAIELHAYPAWANPQAIAAVYAECKRLSKETGIEHHVDHIVPLLGRTVCGLHVEGNLQILPAQENLRKSNKFNGEALWR